MLPFPSAVITAVALVSALAAGLLVAARPELGAVVLGASAYVPLVMTSVATGIAVWIPVLFVKTVPGLVGTCMLAAICAAWAGSLVAGRATIGALLPGQRWLVGALALLLAWLSLSVVWADNPERAWREVRLWLFGAAGTDRRVHDDQAARDSCGWCCSRSASARRCRWCWAGSGKVHK